MSDIKRVVLTTLEPQKANEKSSKKSCKTVRIRVQLPESNEDTCPEFNYKDELTAAKKKISKKQNGKDAPPNTANGSDPFGENDDDVRRIALEMEAKYGTGMSGAVKKKRRWRKDDYADIGAGYDESDSFIDNTDGYDEVVPHNVSTALGGFYINSGALEFKADEKAESEESSSSSSDESNNEEDEKEESPIKNKKKRALDTSDEGENSNQSSQGVKKQNGDKPNISMQQAIKKKLFSTEKIKKQKLSHQPKTTEEELIRDKRTDAINSSDPVKENKKPMRISSVEAAINSVIGRADGDGRVENSKVHVSVILDQTAPLVMDTETILNDVSRIENVKLPENLPEDILDIIEKIKQAAREYKDGGKVKFFSGEVNVMLLNLERKCKVLGKSSRLRVYEHLAPFVKCRKETLIKRAKNLIFEEEQKKMRRTISNLKSQIDQIMPALITNYETECQRVLQRKFSQEAATNEELKNLKAPRRRFPFHNDMKRMLMEIVCYKKRCLLHEGKPKEQLEELLTQYLKKNILVLWPEGWMSMIVLKKYSAIKTADIKPPSIKHPQEPKPPISSSTVINYGPTGNNLTITPVNLPEKSIETKDTIIKPLAAEKTYHASIMKPEKVTERFSPDVNKDNGVIVLSPTAVIPKPTHCQVIDLTETPVKNTSSKETFHSPPPKSKFPSLTQNEKDDIQKVMENLRTLGKLSSPSKSDVTAGNPAVSVIAFNKNYSSSSSSGGGESERASLLQDDFQKQFVSALNYKSTHPPHKSGYNGCS